MGHVGRVITNQTGYCSGRRSPFTGGRGRSGEATTPEPARGRGPSSSGRGWEGDLRSGVRSAFRICLSPRGQWNHKPGRFPQEARTRPRELHFGNINRGRDEFSPSPAPCGLTRRAERGSARRLRHARPSRGLSPRLTRCAHWLCHPAGPSVGAFLLPTGCRTGVSHAFKEDIL